MSAQTLNGTFTVAMFRLMLVPEKFLENRRGVDTKEEDPLTQRVAR